MSNPAVIENKISQIRKYIGYLAVLKNHHKSQIENDIILRGATERYLYLISQAVIDLAEAVIAYKNFRKPATMSECFYILEEEKIINENLLEQMIKMTGFRNVLAHDYFKIDFEIVFDVLHHKIRKVEEFVKIIEKI